VVLSLVWVLSVARALLAVPHTIYMAHCLMAASGRALTPPPVDQTSGSAACRPLAVEVERMAAPGANSLPYARVASPAYRRAAGFVSMQPEP
jgi:hypothetical protein